MKALFYPYHQLSLRINEEDDRVRVASVAAAFLYFDEIAVGRSLLPSEFDTLDGDAAFTKYEQVRSKVAAGVDLEDLTTEETSVMAFTTWALREDRFHREMAPLFDHGILKVASLTQLLRDLRSTAVRTKKADPQIFTLDFLYRALGFDQMIEEAFESGRDPFDTETIATSAALMQGIGPAALYLCEKEPAFGYGRGVYYQKRFGAIAYCFEVFAQSMLAEFLDMALVSDHESHFAARQSLPGLPGLTKSEVTDRLALEMFSKHLLGVLPGLLPRSPTSILEIRESLNDELQEFKAKLASAVNDLIYEKSETPSAHDVARKARKAVHEPLERLKRRLAKPGRRLANELLESAPVVGGGIALMAHALSSGALPVQDSLLVGAAGGALAAYWRLRSADTEAIRKSGVGFLLKLERLLKARSSYTLL